MATKKKARGKALVKKKRAVPKKPILSAKKKRETTTETAKRIGADIKAFFKGKRKERKSKDLKQRALDKEPIQVANFARRAHARGVPLKRAISQGRTLHKEGRLNLSGKRLRQ